MPDNNKPTVLIVDDSTDIRSMLRLWLERNECRVVEAADGKQAVVLAGQEQPDLILMDLYLPELDGAVAVARIREHAGLERVPIVAISAYGASGIGAQLSSDPQAAGFNEYLTKPFAPEKLEELLNRYLRKSKGAPDV
ncbi:MAG: response regulator [Acidobacteria bacterium]|nr:MAG: response regulator [Acidobacteriota bacterium]